MEAQYRQAVETMLSTAVHGTYQELLQLLDPGMAASMRRFVLYQLDGDPEQLMRLFRLARHPARPCCELADVVIAADAEGDPWVKVVRTARSQSSDGRTFGPGEPRPIELWIPIDEADDDIRLGLSHPVHAILYLLQ